MLTGTSGRLRHRRHRHHRRHNHRHNRVTLIGNIGTRTGWPPWRSPGEHSAPRAAICPSQPTSSSSWAGAGSKPCSPASASTFVVAQTTGFSNPILFSVLCQAPGRQAFRSSGIEGIEKAEPWFALLILVVMAYVFVIAFSGHSPNEYTAIHVDSSWNPGARSRHRHLDCDLVDCALW